MSLHKLTAGSGYDYLTRQVAALDATDKGHTGLASYYTERGESPGVWVGSGMNGIDGLSIGDPVTADARFVRVRVASVGRVTAPAAGRARPDWTGLRGCYAVGGTVQDHRRCDAVPG
jgi:hypothetical protein